MRSIFQLLTLIAMLIAPLAAPASAGVQSVAPACKQMDMGPAKHRMPASHHRVGEACCMAIPPAIDAPATSLISAAPLDHPMFVGPAPAFHLGTGPSAEDPPPRTA